MKNFLKRMVYLLLVVTVSYAGAGIVRVPDNAQGYLGVAAGRGSIGTLPYRLEPGVYWVDPTLTVTLMRRSWSTPTTYDYLAMARHYDALFDAEVEAGRLHNPRTTTEVEAMAQRIYYFLTRFDDGPFLPDFEFNGVTFFRPDLKGATRYDSELAHWARVVLEGGQAVRDEEGNYVTDNSIYVNLPEFFHTVTQDDSAFLGLMVHEMVHGALALTLDPGLQGYFGQETLDQALTAQVLYVMSEHDVQGARAALYEHLRDMALFSAAFRAQFASGLVPQNYNHALMVGSFTEQYAKRNHTVDTSWQAPTFSFTKVHLWDTMREWVSGNPYSRTLSYVKQDRFVLTNESIRAAYYLRQEGVHLEPTRWLIDKVGPQPRLLSALRTLFGPSYAQVHWTLLAGEKDAYAASSVATLGSLYSSNEGREYFETNNAYFYDVWFRYRYSPLVVIVDSAYHGMDPFWFGAESDNFNLMSKMLMAGQNIFMNVMERRTFHFGDEWREMLAPLGLESRDPMEGGAKCATKTCDLSSEVLRPWGQVRAFPGLPLAFLAFLVLEMVGKRAYSRHTRQEKVE